MIEKKKIITRKRDNERNRDKRNGDKMNWDNEMEIIIDII